ncbi:MAG: hypothetical protein AAGC60_28190 [Acidobacteriota bacterium]
MLGRVLLDTNIGVHILNRKVDLTPRLASGLQVYLDVTVVGELLYGAAKSGRPE